MLIGGFVILFRNLFIIPAAMLIFVFSTNSHAFNKAAAKVCLDACTKQWIKNASECTLKYQVEYTKKRCLEATSKEADNCDSSCHRRYL